MSDCIYSSNKTDDATDSMKNANREMRNAEAEVKRLEDLESATSDAYTNASAALEINKEKLKNLIAAKNTGKDVTNEEKKIVGQLNDTYGESMGYFDSVAKWYNALIQNSEAYCRQMVIEAKTRTLANQIAEKEAETHNLIYDDKGNKKKYSTAREQKWVATGYSAGGYQQGEYQDIVGTSELEKVTQQIKDNQAVVENLKQQMKDAVKEAGEIDFKVKGSTIRPNASSSGEKGKEDKELVENALTYKDLANNVAYYQQELEKCDVTDTERIITLSKAKKSAEDAVQAFKDVAEAANMPMQLNTLEDYGKKLQSLRKQRQAASREAIAGIDDEIKKIEAAAQALEDESVAALKDDEIRTYDQLNEKLAYYNRLLKSGDEQQRAFAQNGINALNKLQDTWDFALNEMSLPSTTNNLKDIDAAISFYSQRQQREDADQLQKTQIIIDQLTEKKKSLQFGIELPQMQKEVADIDALTGRERTLRIKGIGFDELTNKIKELNDVLNDTQNPVTDNQRKEIESIIATYEKWRKESISSFDTVRDGWSGIKGISGGIENITDALEGNGSAWQKVTAIVDGFIQLYESIQTIVGIINLLTAATTAHTTAKAAESAATVTAGTAQVAETATQEAAAVAAIPVIAANKLATASYMELASAMYFAAHAYIPFAGFGIAAGFVAAATAMVQAIGVMPFAKGGVVSGPTLALVGEYAGATNNPEVVAPLDRLRSMLQPVGGLGGEVKFKIKGRYLVGVVGKENEIANRS